MPARVLTQVKVRPGSGVLGSSDEVLSLVRIRVNEWHLHSGHPSDVNTSIAVVEFWSCTLHTAFFFFDAETPYTHSIVRRMSTTDEERVM